MSNTNVDDIHAFVDRHRTLLARERAEEVKRTSLLLSNCSPKLLESKGLALGGLGVLSVNVGLGAKSMIELERPTAYHTSPIFPPHTIRTGDLVRIEENVSGPSKKAVNKTTDGKVSKGAEGVVYKVSDSRIVVAVDSESSSEELELPERCRILKLANSVTYDRMDKTLDHIEKTAIPGSGKSPYKLSKLVEVLLGLSPPSPSASIGEIKFHNPDLNSSQKDAIKFVMESPEVACIHGPPGTGKTHTLLELIRQLTTVSDYNSKPLRLLVCGASNLSVDNILERLLALPPGEKGERLKVTRIGHPARVMAQESILNATLDAKSQRTDQAALAKDVKIELEILLGILSGKGKGAKGKGPRGAERRKMWDEVKALRKEYRQREGGVVKSVLNESQVVLSTCHSSGGRQMWAHDFDVVIIDEATQALEAVCWIPIFKAKSKLILAGDPMQLPPTILSSDRQKDFTHRPVDSKKPMVASDAAVPQSTSEHDMSASSGEDSDVNINPPTTKPPNSARGALKPPRSLEITLFERLEKMLGPSIKCMLNVQYRMHDQICEFPSKTLYGGKLESHESVARHLLSDLPNTAVESEEDYKEILETPVVFFDTAGCEYFERLEGDGDEGSRCNENEALVVQNWVEKLIGAGVTPSQIAIITPYQAQVTLLTSLIRPIQGPEIEIGTVDGMQGREKDAVVISLVRSNENREVGFLKEKRRLNVAMTRAKRHLCVVGDSSTIRHDAFLEKWLSWLESNADVRYAGLE